jgi:hypothetical protein
MDPLDLGTTATWRGVMRKAIECRGNIVLEWKSRLLPRGNLN